MIDHLAAFVVGVIIGLVSLRLTGDIRSIAKSLKSIAEDVKASTIRRP